MCEHMLKNICDSRKSAVTEKQKVYKGERDQNLASMLL